MLALFTAIICSNFQGTEDDDADEQKETKNRTFSGNVKHYWHEFLYFFGYRMTVAKSRKKTLRKKELTEKPLDPF